LTDLCNHSCISNQTSINNIHAACSEVVAPDTAASEQGYNATWMTCCSSMPSGRSVQQVLLYCRTRCCPGTHKSCCCTLSSSCITQKHAFNLHVLGLSLSFILSQRTLSRSSMLHALQHWIAPPRQPADPRYLGSAQSHPRPSLMSAASGQSPWHRLELPGCAPSLMDH